jgi:hypothetical protein
MASYDVARPDLLSLLDFPPLSEIIRSPTSPVCSTEAISVASSHEAMKSSSSNSGTSIPPPRSGSIMNEVNKPSCNLGLLEMVSLVVNNASDVACSVAPSTSIPCAGFGDASGTSSVRQNANDKVGPVPTVLSPGDNLHAVAPHREVLRPFPVPECHPAALNTSVPKPWSSLFSSKPRNAGVYEPVVFEIVEENGVMIPPPCVMQAGMDFWSGYVVGFFLDPKHRLRDVAAVCRRAWRLHGGLRVKLVDSLYYLLFSSPEERSRVLESEPTFFDGQPFIITPWSPTVATAREQVLSIPVWVYFSQIPSALQPLRGLNWLACNIGKLICFDSNTVARDKLVYAKALIEISPHRPLPSSIPVQLAVGHVVEVRVRYGWVPDICTTCHSFGHIASACKHSAVSAAVPKIPLPRPPLRKWVPKVQRPVSPVPSDVSPVLPAEPELSLPLVDWVEPEHSWVDRSTRMRFNPVDNSFFRFVSDNLTDLRCLYYRISDNSLVLDLDGKFAETNSELLADTDWDRAYIYSSDSVCYDPSLVTRFRPFFGRHGSRSLDPSRDDDSDGDSSSPEEN